MAAGKVVLWAAIVVLAWSCLKAIVRCDVEHASVGGSRRSMTAEGHAGPERSGP